MFTVKRVIALSLGIALIAGALGVLVGHTQNSNQNVGLALDTNLTKETNAIADDLIANLSKESVDSDNSAYLDGYEDGLRAANQQKQEYWSGTQNRVSSNSTRYVGYSDSQAGRQRVVYTQQPKKRSFWNKHRDKLTVGIGAGTGALIGGLAGGKKWAAIGAGIGAGGAALYTYKIRKRTPKN